MQYSFYFLSPFAFLGSAEFRGNFFIGLLRTLVRVAFVFVLAFVLTWLLVSQDSFSPPHPVELIRQTCLVTSANRGECRAPVEGTRYAKIWEAELQPVSLHDASVIESIKEIDKTIDPTTARFAVQVPRGDVWEDIPDDTTRDTPIPQYRVVALLGKGSAERSVIVLAVRTALREISAPLDLWPPEALHTLWTKKLGLSWPFRQVSFSATPYVLSSMVLGQANPDLAARDRDRAKAIMDAHLDAAPAAATPGLVWPRRLNGSIQYACYILFFAGLIYIGLHWIVNILPNRLLAGTYEFTIPTAWLRRENQLQAQKQQRTEYQLPAPFADELELAAKMESPDENNVANATPQDAMFVEDQDAPSPANVRGGSDNVTLYALWRRDTTDLDQAIREMEAIRDVVRHRSGFLAMGAVPAFPRLDVWISGLLAMKSSRSGENVPSFVSVEIEAAAERLEAHQRILAFIVWAIPTLGFIGTVIGIGTALLATVDLQSGEILKRLQAETSVAVEIGVAFDTTLVALALSFVLMLALHLLQHLEESMLAAEKHDALRALVQIENILPNDPIKELRDGLAQMGLSAAQIERWTEVLDGQAPKFRDTLKRAEAELVEWENSRYREERRVVRMDLFLAALLGGAVVAAFFYLPGFVAPFR